MNDIVLAVLSTASASLSAIAALGMYNITRKQTDFLKESEIAKNTPFLYPVLHEFRKEKWIRYYYSMPDIGDAVPKKHYDSLTESEKKFCDHSTEHTNEVYFYHLDDEIILVANGRTQSPGYLIEHHNGEIEFINYGSLITKLHIDYLEQYFDGESKPLRYEGAVDSYYTKVIEPQQKFRLVIDEIKSNPSPSCQIGKEEYDALYNWNIFEDFPPKVIRYNKYVIGVSVWNQHNQKFTFEIKISKEGNRFYREVTKK